MRYSLLSRVLIAIWGFWFTAVLLEPSLGHMCAPGSASAASSVAHQGNAGSGMHHAVSPTSSSSDSHDTVPMGDCPNCINGCCVSSVATPGTATILGELATVAGESVALPSATPLHGRRAYALPFANGPPHAMRVMRTSLVG